MDEPIAANGTIAYIFRNAKDADACVARLREAGFADVRLSSRVGDTSDAHVPANAGLTEDDFADVLGGSGFSERDARGFADAVAAGATLLTVTAGERARDARAVISGERIVSHGLGPVGVPSSPSAVADSPSETESEPAAATPEATDRVVALRAERLDIGTERTTSEARVRREVVTEQKTITVPVRHEELVIERDGAEPVRIPVTQEAIDPSDSR